MSTTSEPNTTRLQAVVFARVCAAFATIDVTQPILSVLAWRELRDAPPPARVHRDSVSCIALLSQPALGLS